MKIESSFFITIYLPACALCNLEVSHDIVVVIFFLPLLQNEMNVIWSMFPFVLNVQPNLRNFVTRVVTSSFLVMIESNNESLL